MRRLFKNLSSRQIEIGLFALLLVVAAFCLCMAIWNSGEFWFKLWSMFCTVVGPIIYGTMLSYMFRPMVDRIEQLISHRKTATKENEGATRDPGRRAIAAVMALVIVIIIALVVLAGITLIVHEGIGAFAPQEMRTIIEEITTDFAGFMANISDKLTEWGLLSNANADSLSETFTDIGLAFNTVLFTVTFTMYFVIEGDQIYAYAQRVARALFGTSHFDWPQMIDDADRVFSSYFRGQATDALALGLLTAVALFIAGVPYAGVVGLFAGIGNLLPYTGGWVGLATTAIVCIISGDVTKLVIGLIVMALVMFIEGTFISPKLLAGAITLHPMLTAVALFAGGTLAGIPGLVVAIPIAMWLQIQFDRWLDKAAPAEPAETEEDASKPELTQKG